MLIGAAAVWILARQVRQARVKPRLLILIPLILAYFGIRAMPASTWHMPADLGTTAMSGITYLTRPFSRRDPGAALPADQPVRAGDRRRAVPIGEHRQDAAAAPVSKKTRRTQPYPGR